MRRKKYEHKKIISFISAAALTAGCFGGISVQAKETTAKVGQIYMSNEIFPASGSTKTIEVDSSKADYYNNTLKAPFGKFEDITSTNFPRQTGGDTTNTYINDSDGSGSTLNYTVSTEGDYTFSVLVIEYDYRYPDIYVDNDLKVDGGQLSIPKEEHIGTYDSSRSLALIQVPLRDLSAGSHAVKFKAANSVVGVIAVVLTNDAEASATATPQPTVAPGTPFTQAYKADGSEISTGRVNTTSNSNSYVLAEGMEDIVYDIFENKSATSKVNPELIKNYINYIGVSSSSQGNPQIKGLNLSAGNYKIYYVGNNNDNTGIKAVLGDLTGEVSSKYLQQEIRN